MDWDDVIDDALASENQRAVPFGMCRRISSRIYVFSLLQAEKKRFVAFLVGTVVIVSIGGGVVRWLTTAPLAAWTGDNIPGALGFLDSCIHTFVTMGI